MGPRPDAAQQNNSTYYAVRGAERHGETYYGTNKAGRGLSASDARPQGTQHGCMCTPRPAQSNGPTIPQGDRQVTSWGSPAFYLATPGICNPMTSNLRHMAFDQQCSHRDAVNNWCATKWGGCSGCCLSLEPPFDIICPRAPPTIPEGFVAALAKSAQRHRRCPRLRPADRRPGNKHSLGRGCPPNGSIKLRLHPPRPQSKASAADGWGPD